MLPSRYRAFERTLEPPYDTLYRAASADISEDRLITDPLRLLTWGTDASFYRLVPRIVVVVVCASARHTRSALPRRREGKIPRRSDLPVDDDSTRPPTKFVSEKVRR